MKPCFTERRARDTHPPAASYPRPVAQRRGIVSRHAGGGTGGGGTGQTGVVLRWERAYGLCVVAFAAGTLWLSGDVLVRVDDDGDGNE